MDYKQIRNLGYIIAIVILFIPVVQLALSTFVDSPDAPRGEICRTPDGVVDEACEQKSQEEWEAYQDSRDESNVLKFIIASVIGLVTVLVTIFAKLNPVVKSGLFSAAVLNEFISVLAFNIKKSIVGLVILATLFVLVLWFINRETGKK